MIRQKDRLYKVAYFVLLVCILTLNFTIKAHAEKHKPLWTPEDVVTLPSVSMKDISSNGKYTLMKVVYVSLKDKEATQLEQCFLVNNENLLKERIGTLEKDCSMPQFIGEGDKFSYILEDKDSKSLLFIKDIVTGKTVEVQGFEEDFGSYAFAPDGKSFIYTRTEESTDQSSRVVAGEEELTMTNLYLQKLDQNLKPLGVPQRLIPPPLTMYNNNSMPYAWSPDSKKIAFTTSKPLWKSSEYISLHIFDLEEQKLKTILQGQDSFNDLFFSPNSQKLAFLKYLSFGEQEMNIKSLKDSNASVIEILDLNTRETIDINATDIWTIAGWTEGGGGLIVLKQMGTKHPLYSIDIKTKKLTEMNVPQISCINSPILSKNQKYIGFLGETFSQPGEVYVADLKHFIPKKISTVNEKIDLSEIQARPLKWKSYDGLEIEGILIYPQGYEKGQKAPLIVSIHGGPQGVNSEEFIGDTWFGWYSPAAAASLGYATLVVNYRGSLGYGMRFQKLNYQDMGGGDFKDIMAGIDYLIDQGIADPDQLFMEGHSYGGFMGAWAVGHTDRFKAASVSAGIVDWVSDAATADYSLSTEPNFGGHYWDNYELWRKSSPLSYVSNIKTPTLILQGQVDKRVPRTQAQQFYQALQERKIPTRLALYFGEGHGFANSFAILDALNETLDWFKIHGKQEEP